MSVIFGARVAIQNNGLSTGIITGVSVGSTLTDNNCENIGIELPDTIQVRASVGHLINQQRGLHAVVMELSTCGFW